jgi:hypothetical protein
VGELEERLVVTAERGPAFLAVDEGERGEARELETLVEDEERLEACVGQLQAGTASCSISGA